MTNKLKNQTAVCQSTGGDWFLPAIASHGNVTECLEDVLQELNYRRSFVTALKTRIVTNGIAMDSISSIAQKSRALENTLKVRIGMLNPEREASWFRVSSSHNAGPFAPTLLSESVFFPYERTDLQKIKQSIVKSWDTKTVFPGNNKGQCLWSMLLSLNSQLESLVILPSPFDQYRLDELPDGLPTIVESPSLRAFLTNVRNEILSVKMRLESSYKHLYQASERFWVCQTKASVRDRTSTIKNKAAEDMREKFKERRQQAKKSRTQLKFSMDRQSLSFMGFTAIPTLPALKRRYIDMAKKHHPDRVGGNEDTFKDLTRAYVHLSERI